MDIKTELFTRANSQCELCSSDTNLVVHEPGPASGGTVATSILLCSTCLEQLTSCEAPNGNHWHCLKDSMWSEFPVVQVVAWRVLKSLVTHSWAQDLVEQMYLDDEVLKWAQAGLVGDNSSDESVVTKDCHGAVLQTGDAVTIIKDLDVKGAGFTAKRGTLVKNISVGDNPDLIEGRVNGTKIYLKTCFLKRA